MEHGVNDDIHVIILFDVVQSDESRQIWVLDEIIRCLEWYSVGRELVHVCFRKPWG